MVELTTEPIATVPILKELLTIPSLVVFRKMGFLLDLMKPMSERSFVPVVACSELPVTTQFGFVLELEVSLLIEGVRIGSVVGEVYGTTHFSCKTSINGNYT